jgi:hypothetical protein
MKGFPVTFIQYKFIQPVESVSPFDNPTGPGFGDL